ncbi:alanine dehydrogenase [Gracilibacillus halophilus YIM-C55.5]|uniref:Alanine dehydrogenase n=1 Tax=Gracilibacillus halophilus YIM-C55.5 TaxID=1308866 RepID=N4WUG4_9BACI|nr:alanine dehydrogenase [Gracilibacillus halophilus]ENH97985.1 alanine dehydrogenase [Gracilibacillus halophilus YIM-C55.5]
MKIGVPMEIKRNENRVAITPAGVMMLSQAGHDVYIESGAGVGSNISDEDYKKAGAVIVHTAEEIWAQELIVKVKEPQPQEFQFFRKDQMIFTYLHLAAEPEVAEALIENQTIGIAYETIQKENDTLPLLTPMSEIAGRMSVQAGLRFLEKIHGGKGVLASGVPGVEPANVVIIGGGIVGTNAAKMAIGLGANVTILDINIERLRELEDLFPGKIRTIASNEFNIAQEVEKADLLIGAVLIPGAKAPKLVTEEMVKTMEDGSVVVDVAVDQGGSIETIDRITTHEEPVYVKHGVNHYAVANIPGAVSTTATYALTNVTAPYVLKLANQGLQELIKKDKVFARGMNTYRGKIVHEAVAEGLDKRYTELSSFFGDG